ncbi:hypothetical protein SAMN02910264_01570 [Ruminococcaceae bacterium YAD3003]|nr:hypothetical protein SAMN02910264_01570 [Ruminococcaceae bacterium YAD3003]
MNFKKTTAVILTASLVLGFTGCNKSEKTAKQIEEVMEAYVDGLNDFDSGAVLELTNWEDDDKDYELVESLLDIDFFEREYGEDLLACDKYIASTIHIDYESSDIQIDGNEASLKVKYKLVDWKSVYDIEHVDEAEVLDSLKSQKETVSIKGKITFEQEKGTWKITKLTNLEEVFAFVYALPVVGYWGPIDTEPSQTDPTGIDPTGTVSEDSYDKAIEAYIAELKAHETGIRAVKESFNINNIVFYDTDDNGIPELIFISGDEEGYSGDLYVYSYNEYLDSILLMLYVPGIVYQAGDGGEFLLYTTSDYLICTTSGGEESLYHTDTVVYQLGWYSDVNWNLVAEYRHEQRYEYDPETDTETYTHDYLLSGTVPVEEDLYNEMFTEYGNDVQQIIIGRYHMGTHRIEYTEKLYPHCTAYTYDMAMSYLSALLDG